MKRLLSLFLVLVAVAHAGTATFNPFSSGQTQNVSTGVGTNQAKVSTVYLSATHARISVSHWIGLSGTTGWTTTMPVSGFTGTMGWVSDAIPLTTSATYQVTHPTLGSITIVIGGGQASTQQTITSSVTDYTVNIHTNITLSVVGAQTNPNWTVESGLTLVSGQSTSTATVKGATPGMFSVYVSAPAGGGYTASNSLTFNIRVIDEAITGARKQLTFTGTNDSPYYRTFGIFDQDQIVWNWDLCAPGATITLVIVVPYGDDGHYFGAFFDSSDYVNGGTPSREEYSGPDGESITILSGAKPDLTTAGPTKNYSDGTQLTNPSAPIVGGSSVSTPVTNSDPLVTTGTESLTDGALNAGINSINEQSVANANATLGALGRVSTGLSDINSSLGDIKTLLGGSGTGSGTGEGGTNTDGEKLDAIDGKLAGITDLLEGDPDFDPVTAGQNAKTASESGVPGYTGDTPGTGPVNVPVPTDLPGVLATAYIGGHAIPFGFGNAIGMFSGADSVLVAGRSLLYIALIVAFVWALSGQVTTYIATLPTVSAATTAAGVENIGPGVAQAKTAVNAGLLATAIIGVTSVLIAYVANIVVGWGFSFTNLSQSITLDGLGSGVALLNRYIPVSFVITMAVVRAATGYVIGIGYASATAVMKFFGI